MPSAFARLRLLLDGLPAPTNLSRVDLHLGESRLVRPPLPAATLAGPDGWTRYPPLGGTDELRAAYRGWLTRRFALPPDRTDALTVEPTPGTKQAVAALVGLAVARCRAGGGEPHVVIPNPGYPTYLAATLACGARPVFYPVQPAPGAGPPGAGVPGAIATALASAAGPVAAVLVCNPGNPRGDILATDELTAIATAAARAGARLIIDECYCDLYIDRPPPGFLALSVLGVEHAVLHSLAKRSGAPGLRSGFVAGTAATVAAYANYNRACGVSTPAPVCAAAARLWADDEHVARGRAALARAWSLADDALGDQPHYRRTTAGFFLWLPVRDDEATARRLWRERALRVMPGSYLAEKGADGRNPGADHLRIALVHEPAVLRNALDRLRAVVTVAVP